MKIFQRIKGKSPLFLISAILILCAGFIIISCGDPELKTTDSKKGQCAIDFNSAPDLVTIFAGNDSFPSIAGNELTVEAWIKPISETNTAGGVFGRYDAAGVIMWVKENEPKFAIRTRPATPSGTSTDSMVRSNVSMTSNMWYHIAGVLANTNHTDVHPSSTPTLQKV
jgi:hypothetical protein